MNRYQILAYLLPVIMLVLAVLASLLPALVKLKKKGTVRVIKPDESGRTDRQIWEQGTELVRSVSTNNSHAELTNVFSGLLTGLEKYGAELNINLEGYTTNENR